MNEIFNRHDQTDKRRQLRHQSPPCERLLWARLRCGTCGAKFRRQVSIGAWVVDFYCPTLRLALEIDGVSHEGEAAQLYDSARQSNIETLGVHFMRFSNTQIERDLESVVETIRSQVQSLQS